MTEPLKIIIVDDEKRIRASLSGIIAMHCPAVTIVAEAKDITAAREVIRIHQPDVVLLDIKMPGGTGIDLLSQLAPLTFKVIFITAFDEFALQAIKFSALGYLLKPVIPQELKEALERVRKQIGLEQENARFKVLQHNMTDAGTKKIVLNTHESMHIIEVNRIVRCEADRNYTRFFIMDQKPILVSGGLKEYDELLSPFGFFRPHHSHLINLSFITRFEKREGGLLVMKDGSQVPVSVRKHPEVMVALGRI